MSRCWASLLVGLAIWAVSPRAWAEGAPRKFSLRWSAPDECADDARLVHQIEALLGETLLEVGEQALTVRVTARGNPDAGYRAELSFVSPRGTEQRSLEHPSCDKLVEAIAMVIALTIDPERVRVTQGAADAQVSARPVEVAPPPALEPPPPPPPPIPAAPAATSVASVASVASEPAPARRLTLHGLRVAVHGLAGVGPLPGLGAGIEAGLGWNVHALRVELLGRHWLSRDAAIAIAPGASIELGLTTWGVRGCRAWPWLSWQLTACAGADLGQMSGTGKSLEANRTNDALFAQVAGSARIAYTRARIVPEAGLELSGALARPSFGVRKNGQPSQTFQPAPFGLSLFFGLAVEL